MNLAFTHFSINCLAALLIIGFLVSAFFFNKTAMSWLLLGFFGGFMITLSYLFFVYCALDRDSPVFEYIHFVGLSLSSICLLQIPYKLSATVRKRESRFVLSLSIVAHVYVLVYVWLFIENEPLMNFESHLITYPVKHIEHINMVFITDYLVAIALFLRNSLMSSSEKDHVLLAKYKPGSITRLGGMLLVWLQKLVRPVNNQAILNRNSALLLLCGLFAWIVLTIANYGYTAYSSFSLIINAIILVMLLFFLVSYINRFEIKSKFMSKLLGISFVFIIVIISHLGYFSLNQREQAYDEIKRMELGFLRQQVATRSFTNLSDDLDFIVAGPLNNDPDSKDGYDLLYARSDSIKLSQILAEERMVRERLRRFSTDAPLRDYQLRFQAYISQLAQGIFRGRSGFNYLGRRADASQRYVLFDFIQADRLFRIGYRYDAYRSFIGQTAEVFIWILLTVSILVIIGFPLLFHINLLKPLNALLAGVMKLNAGELDSFVPVTYDDEVGFLTHSFNKMALSIKQHTYQLESKVKERTREIERLNALKRRFLAIVAHDLRSPLKTIDCSVDEISAGSQPSNEQQRYLETIKETVGYMFQLLEDLSDLAMIEAGKIHLEYSENDYPAFVNQNLKLKKHRAQTKGIRLRLHAPDSVPKLYFDRTKMNQVLDNLIENAMANSEKNTEISIVIEPMEKAVSTHVIDQGHGIAESDLAGVFDEYHTSNHTIRSQSKSTGLGLAIVKKIIEAHRGEISVESKLGLGTTFHFSLPIYRE